MHVTYFTDPSCHFAFSAEPQRQQLRWHYGDQLEVAIRMIGLFERVDEMIAKGLTPAKLAKGFAMLQLKHGMPIDTSERARLAATVPACRAVVATRLHQPEREAALLRALRVRAMGGGLLDDPILIEGAAHDAGIAPTDLDAWIADPLTEQQLRAEMAAARDPHPAALKLAHKLADADSPAGKRYTAPSYVFEHGSESVAVPGFQPWESYDCAIANLVPDIVRTPAPESVQQILEWADEPLATAEIAALLGASIESARTKLDECGARFDGIGSDGYWTAG